MSEQAHFSYQGHVKLNEFKSSIPIEIKINHIKFLVPVQIEFDVINTDLNEKVGDTITVDGGIDLARKDLSVSKLPEEISVLLKQAVFNHLLQTTTLPEDAFQAGEEVYEQAERATKEHTILQENMREF